MGCGSTLDMLVRLGVGNDALPSEHVWASAVPGSRRGTGPCTLSERADPASRPRTSTRRARVWSGLRYRTYLPRTELNAPRR